MTTPHPKIQATYGPPSATRSVTAPKGLKIQSSTAALLDALGEETRALLVEELHDLSRDRREECVEEQQRNRDAEAQPRRDHGRADTVRHELRIARAGFRDRLEGDDHADDRAD